MTRVAAAAWLLGALAALCLLGDVATLWLHVPKSPNEGWNAYHAVAALAGQGLYPGRDTLLFNNYPPLSYFVTAPLGRMLGDQIVAGRIIALLSTLGVALALGRAALLMGCGRREAWLAAMMFLASPWVLTKIGPIDDPQLLGNFLDALGLVVVLRGPERAGHILLAAALFAAALFIKLLFVALPLTVLVWLALTGRRRGALLLAVTGTALGVGGILASDALLHIHLLEHVFSARVYDPGQILAHPGQWLVTGALPLAATLSLWRVRADPYAMLAALYVSVALPLALFFSGGEGVSAGPTFELSMAVALGSAVFLSLWNGRAAERKTASHFSWPTLLPYLFSLAVTLLALEAGLSFFGLWSSSPSAFKSFADRGAAAAAIAEVRAAKGPVLCEMLALCYWADQPPEVDAFGLGQAFQRHTRDESELITRLDARSWALIELTPHSSFGFSPRIQAALTRNYRLTRADSQGSFYLPRQRP
jgi:hypothetical protein